MTPVAISPARGSAAQQRALKLFIVLTRAFSSVSDRVTQQSDDHDLTLTEFGILEALFHKGPLLLGELQKKILLSSGGVTYTVDRLVERGLVERRECSTDRRARYAALTTRGEQLIGKVFPLHAQKIEETMSALTAREQEELTGLLRRLGLSAAGK